MTLGTRLGVVFAPQFHRLLCHSPGLAQRNFPSQHEKDIRGLSDYVLLKRRLEYSRIFIFQKFDCSVFFSEKYGKWPFLVEKSQKAQQQPI